MATLAKQAGSRKGNTVMQEHCQTALVQALSQAFGADAETGSLTIIAILGGLGLLILLLRALSFLTYGLNLSPGFF